jgi:hypothetical protein
MMKFVLLLVLGMSIPVLTACRGGQNQSQALPNYAKTEIAWTGAAAEQLEDQLTTMPTLRMAILWDEKALIYHEGSEEAVTAELANAQANWPAEGPTLGETLWIDGMLPEPPPPVEEPKVRFQLDREKLQTLGLTTVDVAKSLEELELSPEDLVSATGSKMKLEGKTILTPDGSAVPLTDLMTIEMSEAWRPLIIDNR